MPDATMPDALVTLDLAHPFWERFFTVAPLVVIGTREPDGSYDLAPKHLAMPMGWGAYFGFICTPRHRTYHNARREEVFTVTYPRPSQVVLAALAASPRCDDGSKPIVEALQTFEAEAIPGRFLQEGYAFLSCTLHRVIDGFGENSLIVGEVVAAHVDAAALRVSERDDRAVIRGEPLLAYLDPGCFARIDTAEAFPFPQGFRR